MVAAGGTWHPVASADGAGAAGGGGGAAAGGRGQSCSDCGAVSIGGGSGLVESGGAQAFCWRPGTSTGSARMWGCWRRSGMESWRFETGLVGVEASSSSRSINSSSRSGSRSSNPVLRSRWLCEAATVAALVCYRDMCWGVEAGVPPMVCAVCHVPGARVGAGAAAGVGLLALSHRGVGSGGREEVVTPLMGTCGASVLA